MAGEKSSAAATLKRSRDKANRLAQKGGRKRLKKTLEQAQFDLNKRITQAAGLSGAGKEPFSLTRMRTTLIQIEAVIVDLNKGMKGVVVDQAGKAAQMAASEQLEYMAKAERRFKGINASLPLDKVALTDKAVSRTNASVLRRISGDPANPARPGVLARYGTNVMGKFEEQMRIGMLTNKSWAEMRADMIGQSPFLQQAPASWAERLLRTETMAAQNRSGWETTRQAQEELGDMVKILSATFDDRTGWDSYLVHGQIRKPDEAFEGPFGTYQHPPNRPNDREVVVPHRVSWPLPASLDPRSESEAEIAYFSRIKNPGARGGVPPSFGRSWEMSTVDRELFGKA